MVDYIGLENILKQLEERIPFTGLAIYQNKGKDLVFKVTCNDNQDENQLIERFENWANGILESNPINYKQYNIQLYELSESGKKNMGKEMFSFSLNSPPSSVSTKTSPIVSGGISKEYLELALHNQRLEFEKMQLQKELIEQDEDDEDEVGSVGMMGALEDSIKQQMPQIINMFVGMLANQFTPKMQSTGIGSSIDEIISEFRTINPDIESDLHKLLLLAKTKPALFKMLIEQLRAM